MAALGAQTVASSYEQLLHTDTDGGGNGNTLVTIKDGDNGTTFGLKLATNKVEVIPGSDDANAFEVSLANGTALFTLNTSTPGATLVSDEENILRMDGLQGNIDFRYGSDIEFDRAGTVYITANNGSGELQLRTGGQNARLHIDEAGLVGIGTTSPSTGLHLSGGDNTASKLTLTNTAPSPDNSWSLHPEYNSQNLTLNEDSTTRVTFQSGGSVGIGTSSPDNLLQLEFADGSNTTAGNIADESVTGLVLTNTTDSDGNGTMIKMESNNGSNATAIAHIQDDATSSHMAFYTELSGTFSEKMRIQHDGNVGIGHATPQYGLTIAQGTGDANKIGWEAGDNVKRGSIHVDGSSDDMIFQVGTSNNERMRITDGGSVGIGETSPTRKLVISETESQACAVLYNSRDPSSSAPYILDLKFGHTPDNTTSYFIKGEDNGTGTPATEFHIYSDGSFVQTSDRRKKENIVDSENQLDKINQLRVRDYNKINDSSKKKHIGFIAQELQEVFPHLVIEADDEMKSLQIYKIGIVPLLVKAVQELSAKVEALENA